MSTPPDTIGTLPPVSQKSPATAPKGMRREKDDPEKIRQACGQFEEIFLRMILKEAHLDRALGGEEDSGAKLYGDLLVESLAKSVAQGGGIGIGEMLYREFTADKLETVEIPNSAEER